MKSSKNGFEMTRALRPGILVLARTSAAVLLGFLLYIEAVGFTDIPPAVQKKAVTLEKSRSEAERFFAAMCGKCHSIPEAAKGNAGKSGCAKGLSQNDLDKVRRYMAEAGKGKSLYETYCGRCHELINPGSHTFEYWSKNICSSDECIVDKKLNNEEEQQILLYLSSKSARN